MRPSLPRPTSSIITRRLRSREEQSGLSPSPAAPGGRTGQLCQHRPELSLPRRPGLFSDSAEFLLMTCSYAASVRTGKHTALRPRPQAGKHSTHTPASLFFSHLSGLDPKPLPGGLSRKQVLQNKLLFFFFFKQSRNKRKALVTTSSCHSGKQQRSKPTEWPATTNEMIK